MKVSADLDDADDLLLLFAVGRQRCALPIALVVETLRPLPVERLPGTPPFVRGLAVIRGLPTPVLDVALLLGVMGAQTTRFITVRAGPRTVALAVDRVLGTHAFPAQRFQEIPPLLRDSGAEVITAITRLDAAVLVMLDAGRLLPDHLLTEDARAPLEPSA